MVARTLAITLADMPKELDANMRGRSLVPPFPNGLTADASRYSYRKAFVADQSDRVVGAEVARHIFFEKRNLFRNHSVSTG